MKKTIEIQEFVLSEKNYTANVLMRLSDKLPLIVQREVNNKKLQLFL